MLSTKFPIKSLVVGALLVPTFAFAQSLTNDKDKASYAIGVDIGQNIVNQGLELNPDALSAGIKDALTKSSLKLTDEQIASALENFGREMQQKQLAQMQALAAENAKKSADFFQQNAKKSGIKSLDSGVQYKVENAGSGKSLKEQNLSDDALRNATINAHYSGSLLNGEVFDSSYQRGEPIKFQLGGVIQGWQQVIPLMKPGAKWTVYIPAELAYGEQGAPGAIGPNEALVFEIELIEALIGG